MKFVQVVCSAIILLLYVVIGMIRRTHGTQNLIFLDFPQFSTFQTSLVSFSPCLSCDSDKDKGKQKMKIFFLKFRPGKKLVTIHTLKNLSTILLLNIHLFAIRHSAEVARVKIEKLKRIPVLVI